MNYIWTVKTQRSCPPHYANLDNYTFAVSADTAQSTRLARRYANQSRTAAFSAHGAV
jgi:hypothetical protein